MEEARRRKEKKRKRRRGRRKLEEEEKEEERKEEEGEEEVGSWRRIVTYILPSCPISSPHCPRPLWRLGCLPLAKEKLTAPTLAQLG